MRITKRNIITLILILFSVSLSAKEADEQKSVAKTQSGIPLWEAGIGFGGASFPAYPGSDEGRFFALPFPTFVYRGDLIRSDEEGGIRGVLYQADRFEVNLSFGGSFSTDSSDNIARSGMDDLPLLIEIGPSLLIKFLRPKKNKKKQLNLSLPVRFALSVEFPDIQEEGVVFNPFFYYVEEDIWRDNTILLVGVDTIFATKKYMDFFYQVENRFVVPGRPAFSANAGYGGTGLVAAFSYLFKPEFSIFSGLYHARYEGAANVESPLFKTKHSTSVFFGFVWWFLQSEKEAKVRSAGVKASY